MSAHGFVLGRSQRGSMAVEVVILVPVLIAMLMLIVAFGRLVNTRGQVDAVTRDAARAASLERDAYSATIAAQAVADATLPDYTECDPVILWGADRGSPLVFAAGQTVTVELTCQASFDGLGLIGLPGSVPVSSASSAPLDTLRRAE